MTLQGSYLQMYQKNNELQAEITKLKSESGAPSQLLGLNEELVQISKNLFSDNDKMKFEIANNSQKVNFYENEIKVLNNSIDKMAIEIANLKNKGSQPMNYETLVENDQLKDEIEHLQQENRKISEKNYDLEDLLNKFKKSNHFWVVNICNFMTKYGMAKHNAEIREILAQIKDDYSRTGAFVSRLKVILEEQKKFMFPSNPK
jgi:chromosome segregation ATPase